VFCFLTLIPSLNVAPDALTNLSDSQIAAISSSKIGISAVSKLSYCLPFFGSFCTTAGLGDPFPIDTADGRDICLARMVNFVTDQNFVPSLFCVYWDNMDDRDTIKM
jgi:hypothetical protein